MPPHILRVMKAEGGKPATGRGAALLGVRSKDLGMDEDAPDTAEITPNTGGMSVAGCLRTLSATLLPKHFEKIDPTRFRGARANTSQKVWVRGNGPYEASPVTDDLTLRIDDRSEPPGHGSVEPSLPMPLSGYLDCLAATRDEWRVDEGHPDDCPVCEHYGID